MNKKMSFTSQIKIIYPNLTKSEKKVATHMLEQIDQLGEQTLAQLSKDVGVGEATIMRFIYKLGYDSIAEFKVAALRDSIVTKEMEKKEDFAASYVKEISYLMNDSLLANNKEDIQKVAQMIDEASYVYFFGNGTSGFAAEAGAYRFFRGGVPCEGITDVHFMVMKAALVKENELIIAISQSGDNVDIINAVKWAKKRNCRIVTITGRNLSKLKEYGEVNLFHAPISLNSSSYYGGMIGIMVQEFMLEAIFNAYSRLNPERIDEVQQLTTIATGIHHQNLRTKDDIYESVLEDVEKREGK